MTERSVLVRLKANASDFNRAMVGARASVAGLREEIDTTNDRTAWMAQGILALGPTLAPLGAAAVPALAGLATQMTVAGLAAGTTALAFNGVGDALGALNDYQLEPTAENMEKLNEAMAKIGPDGAEFVRFLDSVGPRFAQLAMTAREGMFPGITEGIESFMTVLPRVNAVVREIAEGMGQLGADAGAGLAGPRFERFFDYLETEAKPILVEMGRAFGNVVAGLANMMVAFGPLTDDFSGGLDDMMRSFADWSQGLEGDAGFGRFVDYVRQSVPLVMDFLGSLVDAFTEIVQAAAPVGDAMLPILSRLLDVVATLADTPLGPVFLTAAAAVSAYGRAAALAQITTGGLLKTTTSFDRGAIASATAAKKAVPSFREFGNAALFSMHSTDSLVKSSWSYSQAANQSALGALKARTAVTDFAKAAGPAAVSVGLLGVAATGVSDKMGLTNTTSLALMGTLVGPWGAAVGAGAGLLLDMKAGAEEAAKGLQGLDAAIESGSIDQLAQRLAEAKAELADQEDVTGFGDFFSDAMRDIGASGAGSALEAYEAGIKEAEQALADLKNAEAAAAGDKAYYNSLQAETRALEDNIAKMRAKRDEALRAANAELNYRSSILDAKDAIAENGRTLDKNTREGIANRQALVAMAAAWNGQSDAAKNTTGAHRNAIRTFVDVAEQMGMNREQARRYAQSLFEIPPNRDTKINLDVSTAAQRVAAIKAELASIDRNIDVYVNVRRPNAGGFGPQVGTGSLGTSVPKTGLPYADRHMYLLADGEEVITNSPRRNRPADTYRPVLKAINADMPRHIIKGMLAEGGTAGDKKKRRKLNLGFDQDAPTDDTVGQKIIRALMQSASTQLSAAESQIGAAETAALAAQDQNDAAQKALDASQALYDSVASNTRGLFEIDPLARPDSVWAAGAGDPFASLQSIIDRTAAFSAGSTALAGRGLDGAALAYGLESEDNLARLSGMSDADLQRFEDMFNAATAGVEDAAKTAADVTYGAQVAAATSAAVMSEALLSQANGHLAGLEARVETLLNHLGQAQAAAAEGRMAQAEATGMAAAVGFKKGGNAIARRGRRDR